MTNQTNIEWCDYTVNFWEGCQKVGPGCDHCYAETRDNRFTGGKHWGPGAPRRKVKGGIAKLRKINRDAAQFHADQGHWPRVFCSSLSDVFDNAVSPEWRHEAFQAIEAATDTRIMLLTKRVGNVANMIPDKWAHGYWPKHVGLMITVVNQEEANRDILKLLDLKDRFGISWVGLSIEPMQGAIDLTDLDTNGIQSIDALRGHSTTPDWAGWCSIDWVICGGESGPGARPMHPDWVRSLRDQCKAAGTPFLFKQWGEWRPAQTLEEASPYPTIATNRPWAGKTERIRNHKTASGCFHLPHQVAGLLDASGEYSHLDCAVFKAGKKAAGRLLDGKAWTQFPAAIRAPNNPN